MSGAPLVVFDCNIFLQSMLNGRGPAAACFRLFDEGAVRLVVSPIVLAEVRELPAHPDLYRFRSLTRDRVDALLSHVLTKAILLQDVPVRFILDRDPDDAHYVNLALAAGATLIVSRDNDLLDLMNPSQRGSPEFLASFPMLRILRPDELVRLIESRSS